VEISPDLQTARHRVGVGKKRLAEPDSWFRWDDLYNRVFSPSDLHHKECILRPRNDKRKLQQSGGRRAAG
jgi:hypothetical protein